MRKGILALAMAAAACATTRKADPQQSRRGGEEAGAEEQAFWTAAAAAAVPVEDSFHGARLELPALAEGWQAPREGRAARRGGGVQVEVGSFPLARDATPPACRDSARSRLPKADEKKQPGEAREQAIGDWPTATWSFTRGTAEAPMRSRWAFYARGADCLLLEVSGPRGDRFLDFVFDAAARTFRPMPLQPERQREVDLMAGMGFLERRDAASALERFDALARREPGLARASFGALMAGFEMGPGSYARALPHGAAALKAERELTSEQRQLALRAVGVMQLAENEVRDATRTLAELVVRAPDLAEGQYNYACALARLGERDAALDHLRAALRLDRDLAKHAKDDEDLKSLRGLQRFEQLLNSPPPPPPRTQAAPRERSPADPSPEPEED